MMLIITVTGYLLSIIADSHGVSKGHCCLIDLNCLIMIGQKTTQSCHDCRLSLDYTRLNILLFLSIPM